MFLLNMSSKNTAIVDEKIAPNQSGRVRFQGSYWPAECRQGITVNPGESVRIIGIRNITLLAEAIAPPPTLIA